MFNGLFSSLFGKSKESNDLNFSVERENNQQSTQAEESLKAFPLDEDKDWLFVDRENPEDNVVDNKAAVKNLQLVPYKSILSHLSAVSENDENCMLSANLPSLTLYPNTMDESWFLTPPSCFSAGSIQLEASPLENLLIEHPLSMSVYHSIRRRHSLTAEVKRGDEIEDLIVILDADIKKALSAIKSKGNKSKNTNKKSRLNGNQKSVALVLISKPTTSAINAPKMQEKSSAMTRSCFDRNNKTLRTSYKKNLHTINQPSSRTMNRKN